MSDIIWIIGYSSGIGLAVGLVAGEWLDSMDVLFAPYRKIRRNLTRLSFWELIRLNNDIDAELEARREAKQAAE